MKRMNILLAALLVTAVAGAFIAPTGAYFTTYAGAEGGYTLELSRHEEEIPNEPPKPPEDKPPEEMPPDDITERFSNWTKKITIKNSQAVAVLMRVRAYYASPFEVTYSAPNGGWTEKADGFVYSGVIGAGEETPELDVKIENVPAVVKEGDSFDVVVVYEYAPALYTAEGEPYADWSLALKTGGEAE